MRRSQRGSGRVLLRVAARVLGSLFAALLGLLALAGVAVAGLFWLSLPPAAMQAQISGLAGPVAITLDDDGIPRIAARSELDAAAALGFVHARDRMFQMELMRRAASGRLSEIAGGVTLRLDRTMRVLGLRRRAEADLLTLDAGTRASGRGVSSCGGHSSCRRAADRRACNAPRASSDRQLPDRYRPMVLPHSRLSTAVQGSGAPSGMNSDAASRPRAAIQAFTPSE